MPVKIFNFPLVFIKAGCHAKPGAVRKWAGSSSAISCHIFENLSDKSPNSNILLWKYVSWYSPKSFISKPLQTHFHGHGLY